MDRLLIGDSPKAPERLRLTAPVYAVGRDLDSDIRLDAPSVSRDHARIFVREAGCSVEDLGSENGTFLNGEAVEEEVALSDGDTLRFGNVAFVFEETRAEVATDRDSEPRITPGGRPRLQNLLEGRGDVSLRAQVREVASAWEDWLPFLSVGWRVKLLVLMVTVLGISALITGSLLNYQRRDDWVRTALFNLKPFAADNRAALTSGDPSLLSGQEVTGKSAWITDPVVLDADGAVLWPPDEAGVVWEGWPDPVYTPGVEYFRLSPAPGAPEARPRLMVPITSAGRAVGWVAAGWDRDQAASESSGWTIVVLMAATVLVLLYLVLEGTSAWVRRPILAMATDLRGSDPRRELVLHTPRDVPELRTLADALIKVLRARSAGQERPISTAVPSVRAIVDELPVPVMLLDDRYRVIAANPRMLEALDIDEELSDAPGLGRVLPSSLEAAELSRTIKRAEPGGAGSCLIELGNRRGRYRALVRRTSGDSPFEVAVLLFELAGGEVE